jgi:uroporphyrinogen decarboxylase
MAKIVKGVKAKHPNIPITLFSKNGGKYLTYIADTLCDGIGIDWTVELGDVQNQIGDSPKCQKPSRYQRLIKFVG